MAVASKTGSNRGMILHGGRRVASGYIGRHRTTKSTRREGADVDLAPRGRGFAPYGRGFAPYVRESCTQIWPDACKSFSSERGKIRCRVETSHKQNVVSQSGNLIYVPRTVRVKTAVKHRSLDRHLHASGHFWVQRPRGGGSLHVQTYPKRSPARAARSRTRVSPGRPLLERSSTGAPVPRDASLRRARSEHARAPVPSENGRRPAARHRGSSRLSRALPRRGRRTPRARSRRSRRARRRRRRAARPPGRAGVRSAVRETSGATWSG